MATRTLNVLLTGDAKGMNAAFASALGSSKLAKAGIIGAAAAVGVAVGKALYDVGEEFAEAGHKIEQMTGLTGKALGRLEDDVKQVSTEVPASLMEVAEAAAEVERRLGLMGKPLEERTKQFVELGRITDTDVTTNVKAVSRAFEEWHVATGRQSDKLDELYRATTKSGGTVDALATEITKFAPILGQFNFGFDKSVELFSAFEKAGVQPTKIAASLNIAFKNFTKEGREPAKALINVFKGLKDGTVSSQRALELFGSKGGASIIDVVKKGKLNLGEFKQIVEGSKLSIDDVGESTKTTSDRFEEMANKLKVLVAPAAEKVYETISDLVEAINSGNFRPFLRNLGLTARGMKQVEAIAKGVADAFKNYVLPVIKTVINAIIGVLKGWVTVISGVVKVIGALLHGEFGKAWKGVKEIFSGAIKVITSMVVGFSAPLRKAVGIIGEAMGAGFRSAWGTVKQIFTDGANLVIDVVNKVIDVINVIPGVDIGSVGHIGGGEASYGGTARGAKGGKGHKGIGAQRGAFIGHGAMSGDSVPAMLERGEYVLNRNAVAAVGRGSLDQLNYRVAPRGMQFGGVADFVEGIPGTVVEGVTAGPKAAISAIGSAAKLIGGLPSGNIGGVFGGVGPWLIAQVKRYITGWFEDHPSPSHGGGTAFGPKGVGNYRGVPMANWVIQSLQHAAGKGVSPQPTSGYRSHAYNVSQGRTYFSEHEKTQYPGGAVDYGGYHDATALMNKMAVVAATSDFRYPLLAPIGFTDDGHASGTGHRLGGLIAGYQSGGSVVRTAAEVMKRNGLTANAIGGILGNAFGESSWNPAAMEGSLHNGGLWGFTASPVSLSDLEAYASSQGKPWTDVATQTQFMLHHLPGSLKAKLNSAGSVAEAATLFINEWEHPLSTSSLPTRIAYGEKALRMLGGQKGIQALKGHGGGGSSNKGGAAKPKHEGAAGIGQGEAFVRLAAGKVPEVLQGAGVGGRIRSLFSAPGLTREGRWSASEMGLEIAAGTAGTADETALYRWQAGQSDAEAGTLEKQIANINHQLTTRELRPAQRKHLLERRANLLGKLATARQRGTAARAGLKGEAGAEVASGGDGGAEALAQALAENTAELKATRQLAETATQVRSAEAWGALADILSHHLGARVSLQRRTAGAGKQGTF